MNHLDRVDRACEIAALVKYEPRPWREEREEEVL